MIRRIAQRLDLDLSYYLAGGSLLLIDQALVMVVGFGTTWCFSAFAPKSIYGAYGYLSAIIGILSLIALPGVSQAIQRSAARGYDGALAAGRRRRMTAGAVAGAVLVLVAVVMYLIDKPSTARGALVAAVLFPFAYAMDDFRSVLFGKQRFGWYLGIHTSLQTAVAAATIAAIIGGAPFPIIILANLASRGAGNAVAMWIVQKRLLENRNIDADFWRYGWNLSLVGVAGGISYHLDRVIVGATIGLEAMAAYELAFRLTEPLRGVGAFLNKLVFPRAVKVSGSAVARRFLSRLVPMSLVLGAVGVVGTLALGPLMRLVFPAYPEAVPLTQWQLWSSLASILLVYVETFYVTQERFVRTYYVAATARPVAIIVLLPFFIMKWGVYGAIWAKLLVRVAAWGILTAKLTVDRFLLAREERAGRSPLPLAPTEYVRCPLCHDAVVVPWRTTHDQLHDLPGAFPVGRCRTCGLVRQHPRIAPAGIGRYYPPEYDPYLTERKPAVGAGRTYRLRRRWAEWLLAGRPRAVHVGWSETLRTWPARVFGLTRAARFNPLAYPGEGRRLLDIGCASGDFAVEMAALGYRVEGVEFDPAAAERARERGVPVVVGAFRTVANELRGGFDVITMRQVIEHLPEPMVALRFARDLLARDGVLMVTTPLADGTAARWFGAAWYSLDQPRHYHLFDRDNLAAALRVNGFRVAALLDLSSTTSWTRSLAYATAGGALGKWLARWDNKRWVHQLLRPWVAWLDLIGRGDGVVVLAIRDDRPTVAHAPRECREDLVR